jgi:hypothetical protein
MARMSRLSFRRSLLLVAFVALALFSVAALAQDDDNSSNAPATTGNNDGNTTADTPAATNTADSTDDNDNDATPTPTQASNTEAVITGGATATDDGGLTAAPTLTRGPKTTTYPAPSPPPVADAPFMHRSSAPEGTVFIAVGAILGAFGLAVLAWRGIIACLLHRSVERAAAAQHTANDKAALFVAPSAPFYQQAPHSASGSRNRTDSPSGLGFGRGGGGGGGGGGPGPAMGAAGMGARRTNRGATPSATPSMINLFYSPTATNVSAATPGAATAPTADRTSRYLPSGFYPAPTGSTTNLNNSLHPDSPRVASGVWGQHHTNSSRHTLNPSPPDSPRPYAHPHHLSSSSLGVHSPHGGGGGGGSSSGAVNHPPASPGVRAPSAFLDDMLADNPNALPPPVMPAQRATHHQRNSSRGSGRF